MNSLEARTVTESEFADWLRALNTGFLRAPTPSDEEVAGRLPHMDLARVQGAFDAGRCVATFRSFAQELTVVGGATVPTDAVTNVTVTPTHRRRGLLTRLMAKDLAAARERGDVAATLIAAEYPIYGRYGFGPRPGPRSGRSTYPGRASTPGCPARRPRTAAGSTWWTRRRCASWARPSTTGCGPGSTAW